MKIPLTYCPPITKAKQFFKAKTVVYIDVAKAPVEVAPTGFKLIEIYAHPGRMYLHFKNGCLLPQIEGTDYAPLITWNQPLQAILDSFRVFDFSEFDPAKDKIVLTKRQMEALHLGAQYYNREDHDLPAFSEN